MDEGRKSMKAKSKRIIIGAIIIGLIIVVIVQQQKAKNEQRKQVMIEKMSGYLKDKYNEEFEYVSSYSFIGAGELQKTFRAKFQPIGEPDLKFNCTDNGSLGLSDGFLIVLGRKVMQPYGEQLCQEVFKNGEKYLVYAEVIPDTTISYKKRATLQTFIDNQDKNKVYFDIVVSLYGEYEKEEIRKKVYEIGQLMRKVGIKKRLEVVVKVYDANAEFLKDQERNYDREGLMFKCILDSEYNEDFSFENITFENRFILNDYSKDKGDEK